MDKKVNLGIVICMLVGGVLAGCTAPTSVAQEISPIPTPSGAATIPSCDEPTWVVGGREVCRLLVTPLPGEVVRVGPVTAFVPPDTNGQERRYTVREEVPPWEPATEPGEIMLVRKLFVRDEETGQEVRLGDDAGHAILEAVTEQYVLWRYRWNGRGETTRKTGLYIYVLQTGEEIIVAQVPAYPVDPRINGQWVVYTDAQGNSIYFARLCAFNVATGEGLLLTEEIPYNRAGRNYYAISDDKIAWVAWVDGNWAVNIYDLTTRTSRTLDVPEVQLLTGDVSISGDIVVWWDRYWHGYDLKQDALFTITIIPPGWENLDVRLARPVTVQDDRLYWALEVNDEVYHFTAPIIRGQ